MQILGDFVRLMESDEPGRALPWLPLPWWHRAPLGLHSKTSVFVAMVKSNDGPNPRPDDLIVSVLDPEQWGSILRIVCNKQDSKGLLANVLKNIPPLNIALAESATVVSGDRQHEICLICEVPRGESVVKHHQRLRRVLSHDGWKDIRIARFEPLQVSWHDKGSVDHGWISDVQWQRRVLSRASEFGDAFDFSSVVISADTSRRLIRFVFPRRGTRNIIVQHADNPGALEAIAREVSDRGFNILSALLRRGKAKPNNAVLVAVCEPVTADAASKPDLLLNECFDAVHQRFRVTGEVRGPAPCQNSIYPTHPDDFIVRPAEDVLPLVRKTRKDLAKSTRGKARLFLSRRFFATDSLPSRYAETIRTILRDRGYTILEGDIQEGGQKTAFQHITQQLWNSDGGIVLFASDPEKQSLAIGLNLAHELGFLHGQGKPVLILLEKDVRAELKHFSNVQGIHAPSFAQGEPAFDSRRDDSLPFIVGRWLTWFEKNHLLRHPQA